MTTNAKTLNSIISKMEGSRNAYPSVSVTNSLLFNHFSDFKNTILGGFEEVERSLNFENLSEGERYKVIGNTLVSLGEFTLLAGEYSQIQPAEGKTWYAGQKALVSFTTTADPNDLTCTSDGSMTLGDVIIEGNHVSCTVIINSLPVDGATFVITNDGTTTVLVGPVKITLLLNNTTGDEELVNGSFAADTDWTADSGATIVGGQAILPTGASYSQDLITEAVEGDIYHVVVDIAAATTSHIYVSIGTSEEVDPVEIYDPVAGLNEVYVTADSVGVVPFLIANDGSEVTINSISVRKVSGGDMTSFMTYAVKNDVTGKIELLQIGVAQIITEDGLVEYTEMSYDVDSDVAVNLTPATSLNPYATSMGFMITQSGTAEPVITMLFNEFAEDPLPTYEDVGFYTASLPVASYFTENKTSVKISQNTTLLRSAKAAVDSENTIIIRTYDDAGAPANDILGAEVIISVYPA